MGKHTRENNIYDAAEKTLLSLQRFFYATKSQTERILLRKYHTWNRNNIKDGLFATHLDMWGQLGELVYTKCSSASKLLGEWYIFIFSLKHVIG